jgi:hypothetical protein
MAKKEIPKTTVKKPKVHVAGKILDGVGWTLGEFFLPVPDTLIAAMKKKKKVDPKLAAKTKKKSSWL